MERWNKGQRGGKRERRTEMERKRKDTFEQWRDGMKDKERGKDREKGESEGQRRTERQEKRKRRIEI